MTVHSSDLGGTELQASGATTQVLVEVRDLTKEFGETPAVDGISFSIAEGEIFGFIGPNGAGKTTTMRILATLLDPTAGEVLVGGLSVEDDAEAVRAMVGFMPDAFGVYDGLTVEEYLRFFAGAYRLPRKRQRAVVSDILELTDLAPLRDRPVSVLSRGWRQRLGIARTLIHDPKLLILDEPASALDPRARIELRVFLKELRAMGKTIFISSHILSELSDLCTSIGIIKEGKLVECGSLVDLQRHGRPGELIRVLFLDPCPEAEEVLRADSSVSRVACEDRSVTFEYSGPPGEFHRVVKRLADRELPLLSIERRSRNLESLFMELTERDGE